MDFTADQLLVFATVVDEGSVTAAARALNVTQPAVSSRLRSLQTLAGRRLYRPTPRGIELTDAGEALVPHAHAVARALARARHAVASPSASELRSTVAISQAAIPLVIPTIAAAALASPRLEVRVIPCDATTAVATVLAGDADLAVSVAAPDPPRDDLARRPLAVDEIVLVRPGSGDDTDGLGVVAPLTVLWQARGSGVRATAERVLEAGGVWPAASLDVGSSLGVLAAVRAGHGAGFLPRSYVDDHRRAGLVRVTLIEGVELEARFELVSAPGDLPAAAARIAEALRRGRGEGPSPLAAAYDGRPG